MTVKGHAVAKQYTGVRIWVEGQFIGQAQAVMGLEEALERQGQDELWLTDMDNGLLKWTMALVNGPGNARFKVQEDRTRRAYQVCAFPRQVLAMSARSLFIITEIERDDWREEG